MQVNRYFKNRLQEYCQTNRLPNPDYEGFDHTLTNLPRWGASVSLQTSLTGGPLLRKGTEQGVYFPRKGDAEQYVAYQVLLELGISIPPHIPIPQPPAQHGTPVSTSPYPNPPSSPTPTSQTHSAPSSSSSSSSTTRSRNRITLAKLLVDEGLPPAEIEFVCKITLPDGTIRTSKPHRDHTAAEEECAGIAVRYLREQTEEDPEAFS